MADDAAAAGPGADHTGPPAVDPVVAALVARLPPAGAPWPKADQDLWVGALLATFRVIYPDKPPETPQT